MGSDRKYWTHLRLDASGRLKIQVIEVAKDFFYQILSDLLTNLPAEVAPDSTDLPDLVIQRRLVDVLRSANPTLAPLAACCLRCFVSHQIPQVCYDLEQQFRARGGFTKVDLYPYVLDDVDPTLQQVTYEPLAVKIVRTFDPDQSNLNTWTKRLVSQHKELHRALADCYGIYLASDWAILNHTTAAQVRRLLVTLTDAEVERACQVLESYHVVYRADRLAHRASNLANQANLADQANLANQASQPVSQSTNRLGRRCSTPTPEQLERMANYLQERGIGYSAARVLQDLWMLARALRQLKTGQTISLDAQDMFLLRDRSVQASEPDDADRFLESYRQAARSCLQQAVTQVIDNRLAYLQRRDAAKIRTNALARSAMPKAIAFLQAMMLFHCEGWSMTEIAPKVKLEKQFQVSRLLELKGLQADVHQIWLLLICRQLPALLTDKLNQEQIRSIEQQLTAFLTELNRQLNQSSVKKLKPDQQRDLLRQIYQAFPLVIPLGDMIDRTLEDYATETYNPNRSNSRIKQSHNLVAVCIRQDVALRNNLSCPSSGQLSLPHCQ